MLLLACCIAAAAASFAAVVWSALCPPRHQRIRWDNPPPYDQDADRLAAVLPFERRTIGEDRSR